MWTTSCMRVTWKLGSPNFVSRASQRLIGKLILYAVKSVGYPRVARSRAVSIIEKIIVTAIIISTTPSDSRMATVG